MKAWLLKTEAPRRRSAFRGNERRLVTQHPRRRLLSLAVGAVALPAMSRMGWAQAYPTRPITMVVPFAAGGGSDVIARILGERMRTSLKQPVLVENVGGANGSIGIGRLARAASDGYTFGLGSFSTFVANGALYALPYDLLNDFEPLSLVNTQPFVIVTRKALPANDLKGLVEWLKANADKASAATQGVGGSSHISAVLFQNLTDTKFRFVPYRGGGPAIQDLVAGQIDMMIASTSDSLEQIRAGNIKAYAVTASSRSAAAPRIPTVEEAGVPGLHFSVWSGLWAPARTPKDVIAKLNSAVVDALADRTVLSRLADLGQEIFPRDQQTPEALAALQKAEIEKWWPIIKAANIKGE